VGKGAYLGEFEQVVLLALARLGEGAYGGGIHEEIVSTTGRDPSVPSVYVTLARLEKKGLASSEVSEAEDGTGGRSLKKFRLTPAGVDALEQARLQFERLWAGLAFGAVADHP
jgi:DNA-binding PadR family transcriptional regulator